MPQADPERLVECIKLKKKLPGLEKPPFPNDVGQRIYERVSHEAWEQWLHESVRYINTYRVDLSSQAGTDFMLKQMAIYFGFEEGELATTAWTPPSSS